MMVLLVWLHLLATVSRIGGTIFLLVVLVPVLRTEPCAPQRLLRFWPPTEREIPNEDPSGWPMALAAKPGLVATRLLLTLTGPSRRRASGRENPANSCRKRSKLEQALVLWAPWLARFSLVLALTILFAAVALVRW